jgi:hypothetical protein
VADNTFTPEGIRNQMLRIIYGSRGGIPEVTRDVSTMPVSAAGTAGAYAHRLGPFGRIFVAPQAGESTQAHELTHATNWDLAKLYYAALDKKTPEARQFTDAFKKMEAGALANKLAPAWMAKEDPYRTSTNELTSFAVGNTMGGSHGRVDPWRGGLHVDPTLTTEYSILMDLAEKYLAAESKKR